MKIVLINPSMYLGEIYGQYSGLALVLLQIGLCSFADYLIKMKQRGKNNSCFRKYNWHTSPC